MLPVLFKKLTFPQAVNKFPAPQAASIAARYATASVPAAPHVTYTYTANTADDIILKI